MNRRVRLLACVVLIGSALMTVFASSVAEGEHGGGGIHGGIVTAVPQRVVLPAPARSPVAHRSTAATGSATEPVRARMAFAEIKTSDCTGEPGSESKLGMMEHTAMWSHCEEAP
jgi:hypothetical protein